MFQEEEEDKKGGRNSSDDLSIYKEKNQDNIMYVWVRKFISSASVSARQPTSLLQACHLLDLAFVKTFSNTLLDRYSEPGWATFIPLWLHQKILSVEGSEDILSPLLWMLLPT